MNDILRAAQTDIYQALRAIGLRARKWYYITPNTINAYNGPHIDTKILAV